MTVEDLAVHVGCSARTLTRRFTEQLGTSPGQWLLAQRMASAEEVG
ncbi:AraC family transcriptional regulator [Streptomyces anulatus]